MSNKLQSRHGSNTNKFNFMTLIIRLLKTNICKCDYNLNCIKEVLANLYCDIKDENDLVVYKNSKCKVVCCFMNILTVF